MKPNRLLSDLIFKLLPCLTIILFISSCSLNKSTISKGNGCQDGVHAADVIAGSLRSSIKSLPNKSVAVLEFQNIDGTSSPQGNLISEQVISRLAQRGDINVVERGVIRKLLEEQKLSMAGLTGPDTIRNAGGWLKADAILTATVSAKDTCMEVNARLIRVQDGVILSAITAWDPMTTGTETGVVTATVVKKAQSPAVSHVEVLEYKLEKSEEGLRPELRALIISGKAQFVPSKGDNLSYKDHIAVIKFDLLDSSGLVVGDFKGTFSCGEYGKEDNITTDRVFPFKAEDLLVSIGTWEKVTSCRFVRWTFVK